MLLGFGFQKAENKRLKKTPFGRNFVILFFYFFFLVGRACKPTNQLGLT